MNPLMEDIAHPIYFYNGNTFVEAGSTNPGKITGSKSIPMEHIEIKLNHDVS